MPLYKMLHFMLNAQEFEMHISPELPTNQGVSHTKEKLVSALVGVSHYIA